MIKPKTDKQRHWAKILKEAESLEMSLADYARANNLGVQTLYQWRSTLKIYVVQTTWLADQAYSTASTAPQIQPGWEGSLFVSVRPSPL